MDLSPIIYELRHLRADVQDLNLTKEEIIASLEEAIVNIQVLKESNMQFEIQANLVEGSPIAELTKTYLASASFLNAAEDVKVRQGIMHLINEHFMSEIGCACVMFDYVPSQEEFTKMFYANIALGGQDMDRDEFIAAFYQRIGYAPGSPDA